MPLTKIKVTTGPLEFEMQGAVMALKMPEGITIEIEKEGELMSGGPLKFNIEELLHGQGRDDRVTGD